jgi:FeS assembly SUF system protein
MEQNPRPRLSLPLDDDKSTPPAGPASSIDPDAPLEERVIAALRTCYDPEIPVDIYELGLIYDLKVDPSGAVAIRMTLTSPACPVAGALPADVQAKVQAVPGVTSANVELVWDPPWDMSRMSEEARLQLGLFD